MNNIIERGTYFKFNNKRYEFLGLNRNNTKYPVIALCLEDGRQMKITTKALAPLAAWWKLQQEAPILKSLFKDYSF